MANIVRSSSKWHETPSAKVADYKARVVRALMGYKRIMVWVHEDDEKQFREMVANLPKSKLYSQRDRTRKIMPFVIRKWK